ncbi:hypothetical protein COT68_02005 [bacterium (Candidatus Torokbacteria) CG09_land_8_20_14_0_10_42_11]|nr:MAG: hypothetical protein COT68_02005 [bacterium (Candidatus Torokbacteria) CG09_land_8_20_14_0_10_42_11]
MSNNFFSFKNEKMFLKPEKWLRKAILFFVLKGKKIRKLLKKQGLGVFRNSRFSRDVAMQRLYV